VLAQVASVSSSRIVSEDDSRIRLQEATNLLNQDLGYLAEVARGLLILILTHMSPTEYSTWQGKVVEIVRPYEIKVERNDGSLVSVRIYGIQSPCPEYGQPYGRQAKNYTTGRLKGKVVTVQPLIGRIFEEDGALKFRQDDTLYWDKNKRKYDRIIGLVYLDGKSFGAELLKEGLTWWFKPFTPWEFGYQRLEEEARKAKVGLWADPNPIPPWKFHRTPITDKRDPGREWVHPWVTKDDSDSDEVDSATNAAGTTIPRSPQPPIAGSEKKLLKQEAGQPPPSVVPTQKLPDSTAAPVRDSQAREDRSPSATTPDPGMQPKPMLTCQELIKGLGTAMKKKELLNLAKLRERYGFPYRECKKDTETVSCFECTVVGKLTDSIEVIEQDGVVSSFRYGGCGCSNR
jgi:micrococcal nuclease